MKVCAVQSRSIPGDIESNLILHLPLAKHAADEGADLIVFPELSLTGYEPSLARTLATDPDDNRLDPLQQLSMDAGATIAVGLPLRQPTGTAIGMVMLRPNRPRLTYAKQYLHTTEEPYFVPGQGFPILSINGTHIAPAICYEITIPEHVDAAVDAGARLYAASVAKTDADADRASQTLAATAHRHHMLTMMANCVGPCNGDPCAGRTTAWGPTGHPLASLDPTHQGLLILDTTTANAQAIALAT